MIGAPMPAAASTTPVLRDWQDSSHLGLAAPLAFAGISFSLKHWMKGPSNDSTWLSMSLPCTHLWCQKRNSLPPFPRIKWLPILWHVSFAQDWSLACLPDDKLFPWFWWDRRRVEERSLLHLDLMRSVHIVPESWFHLLSLKLCASCGKTSSTLSMAVCAALKTGNRHLCHFLKTNG